MVTVHDVAAAILAQQSPIEAMKLQKLCYYAQAWHLALFDVPLFDEPIQAWSQGPVAPALWEGHRGRLMLTRWEQGNAHELDARQAGVVNLVCSHYGMLSGDDLSELTHAELPWREAREGLPEGARSRYPIKRDTMARFYRGRQLAERASVDLTVGGLWMMPNRGERLTHQQVREELAQLRQEFAEPEHESGDATSAQFAGAPRSPRVARIRTRRPSSRGAGVR